MSDIQISAQVEIQSRTYRLADTSKPALHRSSDDTDKILRFV